MTISLWISTLDVISEKDKQFARLVANDLCDEHGRGCIDALKLNELAEKLSLSKADVNKLFNDLVTLGIVAAEPKKRTPFYMPRKEKSRFFMFLKNRSASFIRQTQGINRWLD